MKTIAIGFLCGIMGVIGAAVTNTVIAHAQSVPTLDIPMTVAVSTAAGGSSRHQPKTADAAGNGYSEQDYIHLELLAEQYVDDHIAQRWHDKESGVEFVCVRSGCVLTGRSWK